MRTKTFRFKQAAAPQRSFLIAISSTLPGYSARVEELLPSGERVPVTVRNGPRYELPPAYFYRMRQHIRGELTAYIISLLGYGQVDHLDATEDPSQFDCFMRADLAGWSEGFPEAVDDDMTNWHIVFGEDDLLSRMGNQ